MHTSTPEISADRELGWPTGWKRLNQPAAAFNNTFSLISAGQQQIVDSRAIT
jgi:hypothetical protein